MPSSTPRYRCKLMAGMAVVLHEPAISGAGYRQIWFRLVFGVKDYR